MKRFGLLLAVLSLSPWLKAEDRLTILAYTAPTPLDWSSPGSLTRGTLDNSAFGLIGRWGEVVRDGERQREYQYVKHPHAISHLNVEVVCNGQRKVLAGMTSTKPDGEYLEGLLFSGKSMETMLEDVPGAFIPEAKILDWLPIMIERDYVRHISWKISPSTCKRLHNYYTEYQQLGLDKIYGGLNSRPLEGKGGAGCAAYAMSFLEVAGLYREEHYDEIWKRNLGLREKYITRPGRPAERGLMSFVLKGYDGAWAKEGEPQLKMSFWDPQLVYEWIGQVHKRKVDFRMPHRLFKVGKKSLAIEIDATNEPTPAGPIWEPEIRERIRRGEHRGHELEPNS